MRVLALSVGAVLAISALWIGGELHRRSCVMQHHAGCSVLPWENGHSPRLGFMGCAALRARIAQARIGGGTTSETLPSECER